MAKRRVFIIGDTLFAETLTRTLANSGSVKVIGTACCIADAFAVLKTQIVDALIVTEINANVTTELAQLLAAFPDLPILRADLNTDNIQIITSHQINARRADLLAALADLPKRKRTSSNKFDDSTR